MEHVETDVRKGPLSSDYLKINKLGRVPSFVGADGYELTECIAIAIYSTSNYTCLRTGGILLSYDEEIYSNTVIPV